MEQLLEFVGNHPWLVGGFVAVVVLLIGNELARVWRRYSEVNPTQATRLMNRERALLMDVRPAEEYEKGHIPNARHLVVADLDRNGKMLKRMRDKPVVVYGVGAEAGRAASRLHALGVDSVYVLSGGVRAWQKDNLPLTR